MKLRCFGDADCPGWVYIGLDSLKHLTSKQAKELCLLVAEHLADDTLLNEEKAVKILSEGKIESLKDVKAALASLIFTLKSTAVWATDSSTLDTQLRSIGIPSEITRGLRLAYNQYGNEIESTLVKKTLTMTKLHSAQCSVPRDKEIDCVSLEMSVEYVPSKITEEHSLLIQKQDLNTLIKELEKVKKQME